MKSSAHILRIFLAWAVAVLVAVTLGSIIQTQFNLHRLADLGVDVGLKARLSATWHDLIHFTPVFAILIAIAFAVAWPIAAFLKRWLPAHRTLLFVLAGGSSIWVMLAIMNGVLPVTAIAATRSLAGGIAVAISGLMAGWVYSRIISARIVSGESHAES